MQKPTRHRHQIAAVKEKEAALYIGMNTSFLRGSRLRPSSKPSRKSKVSAPPYLKIGKAVRYLIADLDRWLGEVSGAERLKQINFSEAATPLAPGDPEKGSSTTLQHF